MTLASFTSFIGDHGLWAVFGLMLIDALLPAASELVMVYAGAVASGALASQHVSFLGDRISTPFWAFVAVSLAGTIGYTVGSLVGWAIGVYGGRPLLEHRGRWLHLTPAKLERAERWFDRWDDAAVFLGRLTPVVRSFVSIPSGIFRVPLGRYTALTAAGTAIWCFGLAGVGWAAGSGYERFHSDFRWAEYAVVAGIVLLAAYLVLRRKRSTTLTRRA